jgi:hypothetical protein
MTRKRPSNSLGRDGTLGARTPRFRLKPKDIDNSTTPGPTTPAARAALASSVVAHAMVELEGQLIKLEKQLAQAK